MLPTCVTLQSSRHKDLRASGSPSPVPVTPCISGSMRNLHFLKTLWRVWGVAGGKSWAQHCDKINGIDFYIIYLILTPSKLLKTVGLLAVRLDLAELRWKNLKKMWHFWQKSKFCIFDKNVNPFFAIKIQFFGCHNKNISQNEECHTSLNSLVNFQSIGILTWKFFNFAIFRKKVMSPLQKMRKLVKNKFS